MEITQSGSREEWMNCGIYFLWHTLQQKDQTTGRDAITWMNLINIIFNGRNQTQGIYAVSYGFFKIQK